MGGVGPDEELGQAAELPGQNREGEEQEGDQERRRDLLVDELVDLGHGRAAGFPSPVLGPVNLSEIWGDAVLGGGVEGGDDVTP